MTLASSGLYYRPEAACRQVRGDGYFSNSHIARNFVTRTAKALKIRARRAKSIPEIQGEGDSGRRYSGVHRELNFRNRPEDWAIATFAVESFVQYAGWFLTMAHYPSRPGAFTFTLAILLRTTTAMNGLQKARTQLRTELGVPPLPAVEEPVCEQRPQVSGGT